ncbi:MAG: UbiH/UbiF/VisC/COQ6 family ubiquinone biosynthesis hydroxylase [Halieaceae bacterium]|nr:UbiH/UbiF/VisC/COQ6 family ubiquinone biosynthesis hydroxylase [Halieaceae bacterium]
MDKAKTSDVVIVGAGVAGASLALALSGHGLSIQLIEATDLGGYSLPSDKNLNSFDLRVSALTPRSVNILARLGAWDAIKNYRHCPYTHMVVWDADGTGKIEFDSSSVGASELGNIVENRALVSELLNQIERRGDISLTVPDKLENVVNSGAENILNITLSSGKKINTRLLVAADGARSKVRELMGFSTTEWDYDQQAIVATVQIEKCHEATAWQRFSATGPLAFLPLPGEENTHFCSIVWSCDNWLAEELISLDDQQFCKRLSAEFEFTLGDVLGVSDRAFFPLRQSHAVSYFKPLVALVGDSAHSIHPLAGQGLNIGLLDVYVLSEELLLAHNSDIEIGSLEVLARYQRRRRGENLKMMLAMEGFKGLFGSRKVPLRWLRNEGLRNVDKMQWVKKRVINYAMGLA